jgi:hypothetical protein
MKKLLVVCLLAGCGGPMNRVEGAPSAQPKEEPKEAPADTSKEAEKLPPSKIQARHVLVQWMGCRSAGSSVVRNRDQARATIEDVLKRARAGEDFTRLAVEFSDEPNAGPRGGSLGTFGKGQMDPAFEKAAFALKPGEISDIVETPFGYHVILRTR